MTAKYELYIDSIGFVGYVSSLAEAKRVAATFGRPYLVTRL